MLTQQPLDFDSDGGLAGLAVSPVHAEISADALYEVVCDRSELGVCLLGLDAAGERVVESGLVDCQPELLVTSAGTTETFGNLYKPGDHLGA